MAEETKREVLGLKPKGDLIREAEERPLQRNPAPALALAPAGQLAPGQVEGGRSGRWAWPGAASLWGQADDGKGTWSPELCPDPDPDPPQLTKGS